MKPYLLQEILLVVAFAAAVAAVELMSRYRDAPATAVRSRPGAVYLAVNVAAGLAALGVIHLFDLRFGVAVTAPGRLSLVRALAAGFGSAALFRTSLMTVKENGQDLPIGPGALLEALKRTVDAEIDRRRAVQRLRHDLLRSLSFERHYAALTELCTGALQNLDLAEAQRLGESAASLAARTDLADANKLDRFGLDLLTLVGESALAAAADRLREREGAATAAPSTDRGEASLAPGTGDRPAATEIGYEPSRLSVSSIYPREPRISLWGLLPPRVIGDAEWHVSVSVGSSDFAPLVELTQAIAQMPELADLYVRRAEILARLGYAKAAENDLRFALHLRPADPDLLLRLGLLLGDRTAFEAAREAAADRPDIRRSALFELAINQRISDPAAAVVLISEALTLAQDNAEPSSEDLLTLRAECNIRRGEFRAALDDLDRFGANQQEIAIVRALLRVHADDLDPDSEVIRLLRTHPAVRDAVASEELFGMEDFHTDVTYLAVTLSRLVSSRRYVSPADITTSAATAVYS